ncbi:uncharacterized protein LOC132745156 [Ruditapes philippinarum]|uniref:uncharacterized protein LOC132745156 n=1 Tax=Ruditapes philippinarum TaxID=129788 RepID=UPI00295AC395|nr:uncharacterized protein LOC132745156 [Ruditapes philippinarum]
MPSGKEMQLWWSGEAESMFVYYLTGALAIALIASFTLTRSLRRKEPLVTELLHEDNTREVLVTYMLEIVTSPLSGCGCPSTVKVFMQLTGEREMSQYFQIRSNTGGKAMLQRGFTDIFMFKVPESVGEILSVKLLMAGLDDQLKWKVEEAFLYSPSAKQRKEIPVVVKLLEVLDQNPSKNMLIQKSNYMQLRKLQLLYHQWLAMYGNTIRVGAFTEVVHVMSVFMSLFALLVLSQMCYIYLPRGDHTLPTVSSSSDSEEVDSGPFDIKLISLLIGTVLSTVCCFFLTFVIEILIRSVKSREKNPGKAYYKICEDNIINFKRKYALCLDNVEHVTYFTHPLFLRFKNCREEIESKPWKGRKFTEEVALYLEQLLCNLQIEFEKYWKDKEVLKEKKMKVQEASEERIDLEREKLKQEADRTRVEKVAENADTVAFPSCSQNSWPKPVQDKKTLEKEKEKKKIMLKSEEKMTIDFPRFSQIWSSGLKSVRAMSFTGKKLKETYLDVLKKKNRSKCTDRDNSIIHVPRNKVGENKRMQENHLFKSGIERSQTPESFKTTLKWMEERNKNFYKAWQSDQKTWCRKVVRELSDVIRCTREMLLKDQINFNLLKDKLQHSCNTVVQLFVVACSLYCTADQYKQLNTPEMVTLSWHMAVEVLVYVLQEFYKLI